ncbi:hypothetical protein BHM03_00014865 [Ensete ventricosum]|nr:hypothetical protein BHM03_00014865 [Ensete ventricosum]
MSSQLSVTFFTKKSLGGGNVLPVVSFNCFAVTFSRIDPEGKLVMGYRKATNTVPLQSLKGAMDPYLSSQSEHLNLSDGEISWQKGGTSNEGMQLQPLQKRTRNIGAKSRRLLMNTDDALELKLTWEEAQELLRPPPSAKPSIVTIEDYDVEEYDVSNIC